jgi:hypothetical protein
MAARRAKRVTKSAWGMTPSFSDRMVALRAQREAGP